MATQKATPRAGLPEAVVKPSEHPEFFRAPPPPGRSRESEIVLDREGRFFDHGQPVTHPAMARAFLQWIDRHPDDGRYILNNGYDWTYFSVEDAPFRVRSVAGGKGALKLHLDDGSSELLVGPVWRGAGGALYVRVKGGRFDARFDREAQASLGDFLVEGPEGFALSSADVAVPILDERPRSSPESSLSA